MKNHFVKFGLFLCIALVLTGCSGGGRKSLSVAISGQSATIAPNGTFNLTATVANDSSNSGVTWSINGAGSLGGNTPTTVTYTAPDSVPANPSVTITATSVANTAVSQSVTFTITQSVSTTACQASPALRGNEAQLGSESVAFLVKGSDANDEPIAYGGSVTFGGATGSITQAGMDVVGFETGETGLQSVDLANSSYSYGTDGRGCLYLSFNTSDTRKTHPTRARKTYSAQARRTMVHGRSTAKKTARGTKLTAASGDTGTVVFSFAILGSDAPGRIEEFDNTTGSGTVTAGSMLVQNSDSWQVASLSSSFAFGADGWTVIDEAGDIGRIAVAGTLQLGGGQLTNGTADENIAGSVNFGAGTAPGPLTGGSGTYSSTVDSTTGRGEGIYSASNQENDVEYDFAFYIVNNADAIIISTDDPTDSGFMLAGRWLATYSPNSAVSPNGYYLNSLNGIDCTTCGDAEGDNGNNYVSIATVQATNTTAKSTSYINDGGSFSQNTVTGSLAFSTATGRVLFGGAAVSNAVGYVTDTATEDEIAAFVIGTDDNAGSGYLFLQTAGTPNFGNSSLMGNFAFGSGEDIVGNNGSLVGVFDLDGNGGYTATIDGIYVGEAYSPDMSNTGTYNVNLDGSGSFDDDTVALVTNGSLIVAMDESGAQPLVYFLIQPTEEAGRVQKTAKKSTTIPKSPSAGPAFKKHATK